MEINIWAVVAATVAMYVLGALWFGPLFGKQWGRIHGFDKLDKATQEKMMKAMGPTYALEAGMTVLRAWGLAYAYANFGQESIYTLGLMLWLFFFLPVTISSVVWSSTAPQWQMSQVAIMVSNSLVSIMLGAWIIQAMM